jgi:amphi-Trp domain-containing protein
MAEKESLKFSAAVSPSEAAGYLESLARGLREGRVLLESGSKSLGLELGNQLSIELAAESDPEKAKGEIELTFSWETAREVAPPPSLLIVPGAVVPAGEASEER